MYDETSISQKHIISDIETNSRLQRKVSSSFEQSSKQEMISDMHHHLSSLKSKIKNLQQENNNLTQNGVKFQNTNNSFINKEDYPEEMRAYFGMPLENTEFLLRERERDNIINLLKQSKQRDEQLKILLLIFSFIFYKSDHN